MSSSEDDFKTIEELGDKWPYEWISTKGLAPYIKRLGEKVVGVEIGTCRGGSAYYLLDKCPNIIKLYTIDPYKEYMEWDGKIKQETLDKTREIARKNLSKHGDRVMMIHETSVEAASKIKTITKKEEFDFIYIDGDKTYDATIADCEAYYPLLKKGGFFSGHDYSNLDTVNQAINDFRTKNGITAPLNLSTNTTFFWYK